MQQIEDNENGLTNEESMTEEEIEQILQSQSTSTEEDPSLEDLLAKIESESSDDSEEEEDEESIYDEDDEDIEPEDKVTRQSRAADTLQSPPNQDRTNYAAFPELESLDNEDSEDSEEDYQTTSLARSPKLMANLDFILDVSLEISVQLGQARMSLKEVLELGPGNVVKLDKLDGDPVNLLINNKLIAEGQIVVAENDTLAIQIISIKNRVERIQSLK